MLGNKRVSHFASLAKYAVAFFEMSRSSVTRASSRFNWRISASLPAWPDTTFASYRFQAYSECWLTPSRCETSSTGYPRSVIWATASRLNSSLKLDFPVVASCPQN